MLSNNDKEIDAYIRKGPPGTEKTKSKVDELKKTKGRNIILGPSHDYLSEQESHIPNSNHWWGLASENGCPLLVQINEEAKLVQRLVRLKFTYDHVCSACSDINAFPQKECPYKKQFENLKSFRFVLAPIAYAYTKRIGDYEPDEIVVDDCSREVREHPTKDVLEAQLQRLTDLTNQYVKLDSKITLRELNKRPDYDKFMKKLEWAYKKNINKLVEQAKEKNWKKNTSDYDEQFLIPPSEIDTYCRQARVHDYEEQFATPALFYLFDYVYEKKKEGKNVKLTIIDAKPDLSLLESLVKHYYKEKGVKVNIKDDKFKPQIIDRGSVVYKMGTGWYPRKSYDNAETKRVIREYIEWVMSYFYDNNPDQPIGIILWKPKGWQWLGDEKLEERLNYEMRLFIPKRFKNVKIETHGNTLGKNSLKDSEPLFVIGSYVTNESDLDKRFFWWSGYKPSTLKTKENKPHKGHYHKLDPELDAFRRRDQEIEEYQEIHRSRLWPSKKRVFVFGTIPKEIVDEGVRVEELNKNDIERLNRRKWLEEFVRHRERVSVVIAEEKMVEQFEELNSTKWAYREILKIKDKSRHLELKRGMLHYIS
jgi:hypothetical protein